jgi:hypothetical protein
MQPPPIFRPKQLKTILLHVIIPLLVPKIELGAGFLIAGPTGICFLY